MIYEVFGYVTLYTLSNYIIIIKIVEHVPATPSMFMNLIIFNYYSPEIL